MNSTAPCAMCGRPTPPGTGYAVRIEIFAEPDSPPMNGDSIESSDFSAALSQVIGQIESMSADELQDQVHRRVEYRLCPACHRRYLANPLGMPRVLPVGRN